MLIREMSKNECFRVLTRTRLARLACSNENQPYIVPVYLSFYEATGHFYGFTTLGQKVDWMRANPLVCIQVDEMTAFDQWISIIVMGHYEELNPTSLSDASLVRSEHSQDATDVSNASPDVSDDRSRDEEREQAWQILKIHPEWWEPGTAAWAARVHRDAGGSFHPIYYRIRVEKVTGHEATPGTGGDTSQTSHEHSPSWLTRFVSRVIGGQG